MKFSVKSTLLLLASICAGMAIFPLAVQYADPYGLPTHAKPIYVAGGAFVGCCAFLGGLLAKKIYG